jgi:conserved oligomeric Golgi complex subunit 4
MRFDRDLRSITAHLFAQIPFGDVREKFVRLQQISTILNLDNVSETILSALPSSLTTFVR